MAPSASVLAKKKLRICYDESYSSDRKYRNMRQIQSIVEKS
jgi:hypothetical protein